MKFPLISVITVVYNAAPTLEQTIQSVLAQNRNLFEYWIIDGGSTDGCVEIIRRYEHALGGWISEPDLGVFDAMNKGIERASGQWLYFLGGDDKIQPDIFEKFAPQLDEKFKAVFGNVLCSNNHLMRSFLGYGTLLQNTIHHQGVFYNRSLFKTFRYDRSITTQADYELNLILYLSKEQTKYVPITVALYALGGLSAGASNKSFREINQIRGRNLNNSFYNSFFTIALRIYFWQKQFRFWLYGHQI